MRCFFIALSIALLIPVRLLASPSEIYCMAEAIYFEARNQSLIGQIAVAIVVRNRMRDERYPSTACEVVRDGYYWKGNPIRNKCQFSYWCDGKPEITKDKKAWDKALSLARFVYIDGIEISGLGSATHYHTVWVDPKWAKKLNQCLVIGDHKFYDNRGREK
jgi:spore germination cell wall hydrolase CwlJ-like protein